jgi:hypothetical protein
MVCCRLADRVAVPARPDDLAAAGTHWDYSAMKDPRCLVGFHRWQRQHYADGGTYLKCARCGKEHERKADGGFIYT